ncbi:DUF6351 family protein, partial [Actinophytocola sp.]|uniref:DUF6351 family protein n=1 Tax=Actinophytocola sp. TaxID=1872138 RepID=UPI002EDAB7D4
MPSARRVASVLAVTAALATSLAAATTASAAGYHGSRLTVTTVSNPRPEFVSGGDVLVRVTAPAGQRVTVTRNGTDVTSGFARQPDGSLLGLVTGLRLGRNTVAATAGGRDEDLRITNHAGSGPVFAGPQQRPFYCETVVFGLDPAEQPLCAAPAKVSYRYRTTAGQFAPLADPSTRPADLATATVAGRAVPYIVRVETGVIDRAVYETAVLSDGSAPSPTRPAAGWNGRLVYTFGGGCNGGYHQGASTGGVLNDLFLSQGYGVASSTLNVLDNNCGTVISAEAAMMVKEHFAETYGPIRHTIGWGGSGGAIQQYDIADAYPGILDGIIPGVSYPDPLTTMNPVTDCGLLNAYFAGPGASFTPAQRLAVSGYNAYSTCVSWGLTFLNRSTPTGSCPAAIPVEARWDPVTNPHGVKCSAAEQWVNQLGRDSRGFVRSPLDNTGVQYGLSALESGAIAADQFVALNAGVGGYDETGSPVPARTMADPRALSAAYASDLINSARLGLRTTPIIDQRTYLDKVGPLADIHTAEMSYLMRARLIEANGTAANQVIIENLPTPDQSAAAAAYELDAMDRWLTAIGADGSHRDRAAKVVANKPVDLGDGCYLPSGERILERLTYPAGGRCGAVYPIAANPRLVAGADLSMTVLKCRLRPLDLGDYPVRFTAAQQAQLRAAFPGGVCDYSRPGVGQRPP